MSTLRPVEEEVEATPLVLDMHRGGTWTTDCLKEHVSHLSFLFL